MGILVILSAKLIPTELRYQYGNIPSVMLPYLGVPLLKIQYDKFNHLYTKILLVLEEGNIFVEDYIQKGFFPKLEIIYVNNSKSIDDSLLAISQDYFFDSTFVSVLFGDTLVLDLDLLGFLNSNFLVYSKVDESSRWTIIIDNNLIDKKYIEGYENFDALVGLFNFINPMEFYSFVKKYNFYQYLKKLLTDNKIKSILTNKWIDLGHEDNLFQAKKNSTRFFNELNIDYNKGILTKRSSNIDKFSKEISWYNNVPSNIKYLIPRIFDFSINDKEPFLKMEYYAYDTLHEKFLYGNFSYNKWKKVFNRLFQTLEEMHIYNQEYSQKLISDNLRLMYISKVEERLSNLISDNLYFKNLFSEPFYINEIKIESLKIIIDKLSSFFVKLNMDDLKVFSFIHGDYFFSNILYDFKTDLIRLIDPRGYFGNLLYYGDRRYDYAKLLHGLNGKYELIIEDKFILLNDKNSRNFVLNILSNLNQQNALRACMQTIRDYKIDINQIKFIEVTLFLSMVPLHSDSLERQKAMLFTGIILLDNLERNL
jgi:hypothetical protein